MTPDTNKERARPKIDANDLEAMAKTRPDECFLKGSGVLKLIGAIRELEREARAAKAPAAEPVAEVKELFIPATGATAKAAHLMDTSLPGGTMLYTAPPAPTEQWVTENTTASGAAELPVFPGHPEPQVMRWSALESEAIREYGAAMYRAGRLAAPAPVAPSQSETFQWPEMPPSKGQSPVLFEDGYAEGWARCNSDFRRAIQQATTQAAPVAPAPQTITATEQAAWHAGLDEGRIKPGESRKWPEMMTVNYDDPHHTSKEPLAKIEEVKT